MKRIILTLTILAGVAACAGEPPPDFGRVIEKEYDDEDSWTSPGYYSPGYCTGSGTSRVCYPGHYNPPVHHEEPERWRLRLEGEGRKVWITVSESMFNSVEIGRCFDTKSHKTVEMGCS